MSDETVHRYVVTLVIDCHPNEWTSVRDCGGEFSDVSREEKIILFAQKMIYRHSVSATIIDLGLESE